MGYYGASGDYYQRGGIFDVIKTVGKAALGFVTGGPAGAVAGAASSLIKPTSTRTSTKTGLTLPAFNTPTGVPSMGLSGAGRKRRRMNFANGKALTRANRRVEGFVRMAKRSLKHTNYKLVTKGSGRRPRRPEGQVVIREDIHAR